jgi:hypothetical protein
MNNISELFIEDNKLDEVYILIFKTNIKTPGDLETVTDSLNQLPSVQDWSIDQDDIDYVLRIESTTDDMDYIIRVINRIGFECEELPD